MVGLVFGFLFVFTGAVKVKRVIVNLDVENLLNGFLYGFYPGIAELHHLSGISQDDMIVLPVKVRFLVLGLVLSELVFAHQFAFQ